jgi:hypothetical protein
VIFLAITTTKSARKRCLRTLSIITAYLLEPHRVQPVRGPALQRREAEVEGLPKVSGKIILPKVYK